jgi:heterogeneous nuclear ribonucleoprotein L
MEKMNADRLFNLLCLYGNVFKVKQHSFIWIIILLSPFLYNYIFVFFQIKFLKTKEGSAMVQMGDAASVDRAIFYLNGLDFFNTKMNVKYEVIFV